MNLVDNLETAELKRIHHRSFSNLAFQLISPLSRFANRIRRKKRKNDETALTAFPDGTVEVYVEKITKLAKSMKMGCEITPIRVDKKAFCVVIGDGEKFGLTVVNRCGRYFVGYVLIGSIAERNLEQNDEIIGINETSVENLTFGEIIEAVDVSNTGLSIEILRRNSLDRCGYFSFEHKRPKRSIFLRANFSYEPEEDQFAPMPNYGLRFKSGQILKVLDYGPGLYYWQAIPVETSASSLGLIPAPHFSSLCEDNDSRSFRLPESLFPYDQVKWIDRSRYAFKKPLILFGACDFEIRRIMQTMLALYPLTFIIPKEYGRRSRRNVKCCLRPSESPGNLVITKNGPSRAGVLYSDLVQTQKIPILRMENLRLTKQILNLMPICVLVLPTTTGSFRTEFAGFYDRIQRCWSSTRTFWRCATEICAFAEAAQLKSGWLEVEPEHWTLTI